FRHISSITDAFISTSTRDRGTLGPPRSFPTDTPPETRSPNAKHQPAATTGAPHFRNPASAAMRVRAPATFRARFETSKGVFVIEVQREWAPHGADRFYNLVKSGYYDGTRFFRVIAGFMAQFGIHGDPRVA